MDQESNAPAGRLQRLLSQRLVRAVARRWYRHRDARIAAGPAAGLWFNAGRGDLDFNLGSYERPVQMALKEHLRPGSVFYDVGANLGFFSILAARLVGAGGRVYAFEPVPENAAGVRHNAGLNSFDHVTVLQKAVADAGGRGELRQAHHAGGSALSTVAAPPDVKGIIPVEIVAIDELVADGTCVPPAFVKIDVEGAELAVLQGMVETMRQYRPLILFEIDDGDAAVFSEKMAACTAFLEECSYAVRPLADSYPGITWHVGHRLAFPR
jgi:FkbM family methyltransferase